MKKEELKKEAEDWIKDHSGLIAGYEFVKYDYDSMQKAYLAGAEPREKQIQIDVEQIRALQKQNGELTDKVKELEAQIEVTAKSKDLVINNQLEEINMLKEKIKQLEAQIEKMKCCINDLVHLGEFNENTDEEYQNYLVHEALKNAEQFI